MKDKKITQENVICRFHGAQEYFSPQQVEYMDITPQQVVSASVNCIPFVNSDDGVRSMYGCNMQRQALPLIKPYAPIVGTGVEYKIAHDSGAAFVSK
ncbi:hypothetical protein FACS189459_3580 [Bacilli bacterium]|nr:hypothetical protein FACS189459_3580 [Bacilli bacterium]